MVALLVLCMATLSGCMSRSLLPDSLTVTAVAADPSGIPQPHVDVSVTYFLSPTHVMMETPTSTTLPIGTR